MSEYESADQVKLVYGIEDEVQSDPDPNPVPTPNPMPKWAQKVIEAARNMTGESYHMRRTRSQFKKRSLRYVKQIHFFQRGATNSQRDAT